jgi:CRISPR/Cas system CMR subunit Cmr4 (Cas7 group RAMP superfamily)
VPAQETAPVVAPAAAPAQVEEAAPTREQRRERKRREEAAETVATAAAVPAADPAAVPAASSDRPVVYTTDESPRVCRSLRITGTRMPKRVCATEAEWAVADANGKEAADELSRVSNEKAILGSGCGASRMTGACGGATQ